MFSLTIVFGPRATTWVLMFKTREAAEKARGELADGPDHVIVVDDFGQEATLMSDDVLHAVMLEGLSLSREVYIEKSLHEARIMRDAQQRAQNEKGRIVPMSGGPAMLHPNIR